MANAPQGVCVVAALTILLAAGCNDGPSHLRRSTPTPTGTASATPTASPSDSPTAVLPTTTATVTATPTASATAASTALSPTLPVGLDALVDLDSLPLLRPPGQRVEQISS